MITGINSEDRLVQKTFADHLETKLGWENVYAWNDETFGPNGILGRSNEREVVLLRDLKAAIKRLNPELPLEACNDAIDKLTKTDFSRSLIQHNKQFYQYIRNGVPVDWRDESGSKKHAQARIIDFNNGSTNGIPNNRFIAVRELKIQGLRVPHYNRRADLVCYVNGLPIVFIELKAVYRNIRAGFDDNLSDYMHEHSIAQAFYHNAFVVVSNGDNAKYGSITSKWEHFTEWKRNNEKEKGRLDAEMLLDGMLSKNGLLDILENFILFDESRPGGTRKIIGRNHQVLGVNNAVKSVEVQEELKKKFEGDKRLIHYEIPVEEIAYAAYKPEIAYDHLTADEPRMPLALDAKEKFLPLVKRAHPDLGRLGVFWHTQGSGKSYSMSFFVEKVRRHVPGNFTFVLMTDRDDLDSQIFRTFVGCDVADEKSPRASSGKELESLLKENHRLIFTLIHKFNKKIDPNKPYSLRDDIIVISDEAHRTQSGMFARNMRLALPNASFIGFTGTPLLKHDGLTKRIFGGYVSRYDFKRSQEDNSTVKLIYENRGEKLGITKLDLNDAIADKVEQADLDPDQTALLEKLLGKDYEVITADDRLLKLAKDFVEHATSRWECGKSMLVCIDKITCGRMHNLIVPLWNAKLANVRKSISQKQTLLNAEKDGDGKEALTKELGKLENQAKWIETTCIQIIISESQNEVRDFQKWGVDIIPHRSLVKKGFEQQNGETVSVEDAFKIPDHPFRIAIVCAMWLTGFDVECLQTLYLDKPLKAHTLMQAIARANRVYPGKDCGVIVDYNGMLKSLNEALASYALGDDDHGTGDGDGGIVAPIEELVLALILAIEEAENHLRKNGFDPAMLIGAIGFDRIQGLRDGVDALYASDEIKRRYEIMARQVFARMKLLVIEPSAYPYVERHDNIEAIYKKLQERRDTADVTELLKELHKIVNAAIQTQGSGKDHATGLTVDLSKIDFEKLRAEFASKIKRKNSVLQDIRDIVEKKLQLMLAMNPQRMDYYKKYQEIIADYNREKDRATVEDTFRRLTDLAGSLDEEQKKTAAEGLKEDEKYLFDLLYKDSISKKDREKLKQASISLLSSLRELLKPMKHWTENAQTQAEVEVFILNNLCKILPMPPFTENDAEKLKQQVYDYVWQRTKAGDFFEENRAA
jgi:type I restriction enzyme R subunit